KLQPHYEQADDDNNQANAHRSIFAHDDRSPSPCLRCSGARQVSVLDLTLGLARVCDYYKPHSNVGTGGPVVLAVLTEVFVKVPPRRQVMAPVDEPPSRR